LVLLLLFDPGRAQATGGETNEEKGDVKLTTTLRYLGAWSPREALTLQAGEEGALRIRFALRDPERVAFEGPLTVRVAVPEASELSLRGADRRGSVVQVPLPEGGGGAVTATLPILVSSRARVKTHALRLHVSAPLLARAGGFRLHDSGAVTVPVQVQTPRRTKVIVLIVIAFAVFLFMVEWLRVDLVAILLMLALPLLCLIDARDTFKALGSNAVVTLIGLMIISAGLKKIGLVSRMARPVIRMAGRSTSQLSFTLSLLVAAISSVMETTGAAAQFLPGIQHACRKRETPIANILMPIGMCAILGGTLTMVGTVPLVLLNDVLPEGMAKLGLLDVTPIGGALVLAGLLYFSTVGRLLLDRVAGGRAGRGRRRPAAAPADVVRSFYHDLGGPFEIVVPADFVPETIVDIRREHQTNIVALSEARGQIEIAPNPTVKVRPGQSLFAYGPEAEVRRFADEHGLEILDKPRRFRDLSNPAVAGVVEAVVSPRAGVIGSTIKEIGFRKNFGVTVLALYREGQVYYSEVSDIPLVTGDALLLHSTWERFQLLQQAHRKFTIITPLEVEVQRPGKTAPALLCLLATLALMLLSALRLQLLPENPAPIPLCLMLGAFGMVVLGVLSIKEAYEAIDWRSVFLIGGLIPLAMAVYRTGTAEWLASAVVSSVGDGLSPVALLLALAAASSALCLVIADVGACALLVPPGAFLAARLGVDPRAAAVVIGLSVTNSFLLPTHQVNALYMGPGDYRTRDYVRVGGGLSLVFIAIVVLMTHYLYA
jgi:di/tricarboxylate transporter